MLGSPCFLLHTEWMELTFERAGDKRQVAGQACYTPSARAAHPQGCLRFCITPKVSSVCVLYMCACERVSASSLRNIHFGTGLVTLHTC